MTKQVKQYRLSEEKFHNMDPSLNQRDGGQLVSIDTRAALKVMPLKEVDAFICNIFGWLRKDKDYSFGIPFNMHEYPCVTNRGGTIRGNKTNRRFKYDTDGVIAIDSKDLLEVISSLADLVESEELGATISFNKDMV